MYQLEDMAEAAAEMRTPRASQPGQRQLNKSRFNKSIKEFSLGRVLSANPDEAYHMLEKLSAEVSILQFFEALAGVITCWRDEVQR